MQKSRFLRQIVLATVVVATMGLANAHAQSQKSASWCAQQRAFIQNYWRQVNNIAADREAGINGLRSEQQQQAWENLQQWYNGRIAGLKRQIEYVAKSCNEPLTEFAKKYLPDWAKNTSHYGQGAWKSYAEGNGNWESNTGGKGPHESHVRPGQGGKKPSRRTGNQARQDNRVYAR